MRTIKPSELKSKLNNGSVLLIDVRELAEYKAEHIIGSQLIPLKEISYERLPEKPASIVLYCKSGKRSEQAYKKLIEEDPDLDLYLLEGGIESWKVAGNAVKDLGGMPLERQTQIAAGLLIFSGIMAGYFISEIFYLVSGFVGAGLIFAGVTGWCGMMRLLAKMPWNR